MFQLDGAVRVDLPSSSTSNTTTQSRSPNVGAYTDNGPACAARFDDLILDVTK